MNTVYKTYYRLRSFLLFHSLLFLVYIIWIHFIGKINFDYIKIISIVISYFLAGFGAYLVNDFFDQKQDFISNKPNLAASISSIKIWLSIVLLWLIALLLLMYFSSNAAFLLLIQFLLLLLYSIPLSRLKEQPIIGVLVDACYAHVLPIILLFEFFNLSLNSLSFAFLIGFNLSVGIRDIIIHQQKDRINDLKTLTKTFAIKYFANLNIILQIIQLIAILCLSLFFMFTLNKESQLILFCFSILSNLSLVIISLTSLKKSLENNYLIRFFVLFSILVLNFWFIELDNYFALLLLLHPYFLNFLSQTKNFTSLIINYLLYQIFIQFGRDIKKRPLYNKKNYKS